MYYELYVLGKRHFISIWVLLESVLESMIGCHLCEFSSEGCSGIVNGLLKEGRGGGR